MAFRVWGVEALQLTVRPILQGSFAPFPSQTWSPPRMSSIFTSSNRSFDDIHPSDLYNAIISLEGYFLIAS